MSLGAILGVFLGVTIAYQCDKKKEPEKKKAPPVCKVVAEVGGCNQYYCGVKFTDGTYTGKAESPVAGMEMCEIAESGYWRQKRKK